ncbi:MAG TPA: BTAD domain-containing putative transcriptional regulator [Acidimicrobiales bacterium]|nr:BTAD domain-containing putative transcriptional regulator [Acidimicrobiales bacterium]
MTGASGERVTPRGRGRRLLAVVTGGAAGAPVETWTVLFTDQVGSTEMRVRVGEEAFDGIRGDLDTRVAAALTAQGVVVTKPTGDGVMGGFTSTVAALRCAVAIQQAVAERNRTMGEGVAGAERLALRIGISVGDAVVDNGDLQGTAVVEAARLCAAASGGTILCSEAVRVVSANRSGCSFGPVRPVQLKGLPGPVPVHDVNWAPLPYDPGEHRLAFRVLGPLEVLDGNRQVVIGGPKERLVLALLLARVNSPVSVDALMDAVWGDRPPRTAERTVHAYVARVRRTLEPRRPRGEPSTVLETVGRGYQLRLDATQLDATRFGDLAKRGSDQLVTGDDAASSTLRQALGLWRGEAFGEFREVEACVAEGRRLEELRLGLVEDRVDADLAAGQSTELVGEIEALLRDEPFRERLWGQLMLALYRSGRQRDALEAYQRARRLLADELGIEPGPDLRRLEAALLAQDPSLDVLRPVPAATVPRGLPAPLAAVGPAFLGRESEVAWLREAWTDAIDGRGGLVSVLGPEGIGKTRLVAELARDVHDEGAAVLYGRCDHAHRGSRALLGQALQSAGSSLGHIDGGAGEAGDIAEAVARHLPTWSQGHPVLVVLDDLHLADAETLEVVADLAGWCRAAPMLVVATFRSDAVHPTTPAGPPGSKASQFALGPLPSDAVGHICELYATEPWSAEDIDRVYELTGGVPLLVHEQASEWARERAGRRMAEATDRGAASRRRLLASRGEVADGVEGIQRLLEQRRAQLAGREAQLQATAVAALAGCPYKGLARFEESDAANFFGRERLVAELVARLAEARILAVVGPSGSGKSSLIRAGLLAALATGVLPGAQPWRSAILCPGPRPAQELAHKLHEAGGPAGGPRVVFVDQFEETFTAGAERHEQDEFVAHLLDVVDRPDTAVVLAIRADHLDRCATFPELADRLDGNDVLVGPMRDSELRRTVELPAQRAGLEIEGGLVDVIVSEVAGRAGALPLLSTALAETWERREARVLTLAGYRAAGGVNGALARMAEDAYAGLPAGPRGAARRLLLRLCDAGEEGDLTLRRRLPLDEARDEDDSDARAALETLADRRLLTIDSDSVEVAHEALLREWPRLRTWLDEDVQGRRLHRRLHDAARSWDAADHDPSELYRGTRLGAAADWAAHHDDELSQAERAFLDASQARSEQELAHARRQAADRARSNRRLRTLLAGIGVLLVVAVVAGLLAVRQAGRADQQATIAEARRVGTQALVEPAYDRALLLAVEGVHLRDNPEIRGNLLSTIQRSPQAAAVIRSQARPTHLVMSPDGQRALVNDQVDDVTLYDLSTGAPIATLAQDGVAYKALSYSPDGERVAVLEFDSDCWLWPSETDCEYDIGLFAGDDLRPLDVTYESLWAVVTAPAVFSPSGDMLAAIDVLGRGEIALWGDDQRYPINRLTLPDTGPVVNRVLRTTGVPGWLRFSADGALLYASSQGPVFVIDVATGRQLRAFDGTGGLALSPDGRTLVVTRSGAGPGLFDTRTGRLTAELVGHDGPVFAATFSPDGSLVATVSDDRTAAVWDATTGEQLHLLEGHAGEVTAASFGADGATLYTLGLDGALFVWDLEHTHGLAREILPPAAARGAQFAQSLAPGAETAVYVTVDRRRLFIVNVATGQRRELKAPSGARVDVTWVATRPDSRRVVTVETRGTVRLWDIDTGEMLAMQGRGRENLGAVAFTPDGEHVVVADADGRVTELDGQTLELTGRELETGIRARTIRATHGGLVAAMASGPQVEHGSEVVIADIDEGRVLHRLDVPLWSATPNFSPDGRTYWLGGWDGRVARVDVASGALSGPPERVHDAPVNWLAFSPDGRTMVSQAADGKLALWDAIAGTPTAVVQPGPASVGAVAAYSDDGHTVIIAYDDGSMVSFETDPNAWEAHACEVAGRNLTQDEWNDAFADRAYERTCPQYPPDSQ